MNRKKKKNKVLAPAIMLCLIVVMLIVYLSLQKQPAASSNDTGGDSVTMILERSAADLEYLSYTWQEETNAFDYDASSGTWSVHGDDDFPLTQEGVATMAAAISQIGVYRTLDTGDTGEFGFDTPVCSISIRFTDGETHNYQIGDRNTTSGNYYFKDTDTGVVYMISSSLLPYFQYSINDFFSYETLPTDIDEAYVTAASLSDNAGTISLSTTDADNLPQIYQAFTQFAPYRYAAWKDDADIRAQYGIGSSSLTLEYKRAVTVTDTSGNSNTTRIQTEYTIRFGTVTEDGYIPYTIGNSHIIYLADAKLYDDLIDSFTASDPGMDA